jgi:hypothetical protein
LVDSSQTLFVSKNDFLMKLKFPQKVLCNNSETVAADSQNNLNRFFTYSSHWMFPKTWKVSTNPSLSDPPGSSNDKSRLPENSIDGQKRAMPSVMGRRARIP